MKYADAKAMWESAKDKIRGKLFGRRSRADARIVKTNEPPSMWWGTSCENGPTVNMGDPETEKGS